MKWMLILKAANSIFGYLLLPLSCPPSLPLPPFLPTSLCSSISLSPFLPSSPHYPSLLSSLHFSLLPFLSPPHPPLPSLLLSLLRSSPPRLPPSPDLLLLPFLLQCSEFSLLLSPHLPVTSINVCHSFNTEHVLGYTITQQFRDEIWLPETVEIESLHISIQ